MNKKLIKSIVSITCGLGVVATIPLATTSCGCSSSKDDEYTDVLPYEVYEIKNNVLMGFTSEFLADQNKYDKCYTMKIPSHVTSINTSAFYSSSKGKSTIPKFIKHLTFPEGSECSTIGGRAFYKCQSLTSVIFPSSLTEFTGQYAFSNCPSLTSADLSSCSSMTSINSHAFSSCSSLQTVKFPPNLKTIKSFAFDSCTSLETIDLPQTFESFDDYSFLDAGLTSLDLSNLTNLTTIKGYSFNRD